MVRRAVVEGDDVEVGGGGGEVFVGEVDSFLEKGGGVGRNGIGCGD